MENEHKRRTSRIWPMSLGVAMLLAGAALAGAWLQLFDGSTWQVPACVFGVGAVMGLVRDSRVRARRRLHSALDIYAEREIARELARRAADSPVFARVS